MTHRASNRPAARRRKTRRATGSAIDPDIGALLTQEARRRGSARDTGDRDDLLAAARLFGGGDVPAAVPRPEPDRRNPSGSAALLAPLFRRAVGAQQAGRIDEAEAIYRAILALDRSHAMVWSNLAVILIDRGQSNEAIAACRSALALAPDHFNAQLNLATALQQNGAFAAAAKSFREILARHPRRPDLWKSLAAVLERDDRPAEAIEAYDAMIAIDPSAAAVHALKAEALKKIGRIDEAIACFAETVRLAPDDALAMSSMGILIAMDSLENDLDMAAAHCVKAALLMPTNAAIINNLGVVLQIRNNTDSALQVLRQLVAEQPDFAPAYSNIGSIFSSKSRYDEAEEAFLKALELDPGLTEAQIELTKVRRHLCNWQHHDADRATIRALKGRGTNFMIVLMAVSSSAREQLDYARSAMAKYNRSRARVGPHRNAFDPKRLRIGYISADFREHPVGRLLPDLLTKHDRDRFEVFGYALGSSEMSPLRYRLACSFDHFVDCNKLSDAEAASRIQQDGIDILIDLTGPTAGSRFEILSQRPAPIQVSFLGLPGTCGADCIDYIVADHVLIPDGHESFFHERVVRLPDCYQPSDTSRTILSPLPSRTDCGLPEHGFVFCSFNSPVKITPEVFDVWMRLLHAVEGSVLWLYCKAEKTKDNLLAQARRAGICADRIIFAKLGAFDVYLTRMVCADLFLDTYPYAAGATCNDALWAGLPVLTCIGETYVSRMAGSQLTSLGLPELVTRSLDEYQQVALDLATQPGRLKRLRERLVAERDSGPLFDMRRFTASLEAAYARMAAIAIDGGAPEAFDVAAQT